ncbi:MAG: hypothetical protein AMXMBFR84_07360 [Candidatus Hydrogenedentota bacterium]
MAFTTDLTVDEISFPGIDALPVLEILPDPLMLDGKKVTSAEEWSRHREHLRSLMLHYEYGQIPPPPESLTVEPQDEEVALEGKALLRRFTLRLGPDGSVPVECGYYLPASGRGPFPVIVAVDPVFDVHVRPIAEQVTGRGFAFAGFRYLDVARDEPQRDSGVYAAYPNFDWGTIAAWAWGCSRLIDHLVTIDSIDPERIVVTGHSRCGKAALLCGALDERVAVTAPHCSGEGGTGSHRIQGPGAESLDAITDPQRFHYWFHPRLREFASNPRKLPFDQHFVMAMIAPRALVCVEADEDRWANPSGARIMAQSAMPVYDLFGAREKLGYYLRKGTHDPTAESWQAIMDFGECVFQGKTIPPAYRVTE